MPRAAVDKPRWPRQQLAVLFKSEPPNPPAFLRFSCQAAGWQLKRERSTSPNLLDALVKGVELHWLIATSRCVLAHVANSTPSRLSYGLERIVIATLARECTIKLRSLETSCDSYSLVARGALF